MTSALTTLKTIDRWVGWKYEERKGKLTKIPKNARTGQNASSVEPSTWSSYQQAVAAQQRYGLNGMGFVFAIVDDLAGIDLDDCLDEQGHIQVWAARIVEQVNSYSEISPSGRGIKIFFRGSLPAGGRKKGHVEFYEQGRFFTVTGEHWPESPDSIEERTNQVAELHRQIFAPPPRVEPKIEPVFRENCDQELIGKAISAANGKKFQTLWQGNAAGYHSRSEAHLALCNLLAFWTGNNEEQMDRLFRQSGFFTDYADKWDKQHFSDGRTYGQATIQKAIGQQNTVYSPRSGNGNGNGDRGNPPAPTEAAQHEDEATAQTILTQEHIPYYSVKHGQMVYHTWKSVSGDLICVEKYVAPFAAHIEEKMTVYSETDQNVFYTLVGKKGPIPFTARISADEWADYTKLIGAILKHLPGKPPDTDPNLRKHWGPAIAHLTDEEQMTQINAIPCTGWSPDGQGFVMPAGSVGRGYVCYLDDAINYELAHFGLVERKAAEIRAALASLLWLDRIYHRSVIYTLLAHAFLPPLLRWIGDDARYLYHIYADTGSLKTELAKLIMGLYGPNDSMAITYKWSNTPYGAESRAYALKDCLMFIDDLKPGTISEQDKQKWVAFVQAAVDALGRKRATMGGKAATSLPPRAIILSTGEAIPEAGEASYTARMLLAELNSQPEGRNRLLDRIKEQRPLLSGLMYDYVAWLLAGDGQGALIEFKRIQGENSISTTHTRLAANFASNRLAAVMLAKFASERGYFSRRAAANFLERHHQALITIVNTTDSKAFSERYSQRFIAALHDALSTGYCYLSNEEKGRDKRVGWSDEQYIYLLGGAKEIVDQWLRQSGQIPINISKKDLRKQLYHDGITYSTKARVDRGQYDYQAEDPVSGDRMMVTAIYKAHFYQAANDE